MAKKSLFAVLSRSPWWLSLVIAAVLFVGLRAVLPTLVAASASIPLIAIALYAAWRQWRVPNTAATALALQDMRELPWERFSVLIVEAFRRDGYEVTAIAGGAADFELRRGGRVTLAGCKRWKAAHTGVGPLRDLIAARQSREADECMYVTLGELSTRAQVFAAENRVRLIGSDDLARLVARVPKRVKKTQ